MRPTIACAPVYGVAGSPVVPITSTGGEPDTLTGPRRSPFVGFGMPTHDAVAQLPPQGGSCDWNVAMSASSAAVVGALRVGRSTQLITALASTSGSQ